MRRLAFYFRPFLPAVLLQLVAVFLMVAATLELPVHDGADHQWRDRGA